MYSKFAAAVLTRSFDYGAEMRIPRKDIDLASAQGEELGVPMWVCEAARLVFKHAMHKGAAKEDLTAIHRWPGRPGAGQWPGRYQPPEARRRSVRHRASLTGTTA